LGEYVCVFVDFAWTRNADGGSFPPLVCMLIAAFNAFRAPDVGFNEHATS
jgi:hypothetical protein